MKNETDQVISDFVERMGLIVQADGMPRIAGRIMGLLVMQGGPFSFAELAERLRVSRASISTNTRLLEDLGVIERTTVPGERQDFFKLRPQPYARMLRGYVERMRRARDVVDETRDALPRARDDARARLDELDMFYEALIESFISVIERWEKKAKPSHPKARRSRAKLPA